MKNAFPVLLLLLLAGPLLAPAQRVGQPYLLITLGTGGDDLRGGQSLKAAVHFRNGKKSWYDIDLNEGHGWANNSTNAHQIELYQGEEPGDFLSLVLFHDGSPTQAFQSYDNWNLDRIRVIYVNPSRSPQRTVLLDRAGQPLKRFTGDPDQNTQGWVFDPVANPVSRAASGGQSGGSAMVRIVRWKSPVTGDFETIHEPRNPDAQLQSWGYSLKTYQYSAYKTRPSGADAIAIYRWIMPNCAAWITLGEHEISDGQLQSWGYKSKELMGYAYRTKPATGDFVAVNRWINAKPQGEPCRDFTLSVAETEYTDGQLLSYGYTEKRLQFWVPRPQ